MAIIEKLSPIKRRFFAELGIFKDEDIPQSFFETIRSYSDDFNEDEHFCLSDYNIAFCSESLFSVKDIIGTNHDRYANKTWLEAFLDLARGDELLKLYFDNPSYYESIKSKDNCDIGLAKKNDKYYIFDRAGGGNNRMIIMKIKYLALANKPGCDLQELERQLSFYGNIRISPREELAKSIFYLMFPNGGFEPSGYYVLNKTTNIERPLYDIVANYPRKTQIVLENVDENELLNLNIEQSTSNNLKR